MKPTFLRCLLLSSALLPLGMRQDATAGKSLTRHPIARIPRASSLPIQPIRILIDKSDYELQVYDNKGWYATFPVVFGNNSLADKCMEGDRCTPEGSFKIANKRIHNKWSRYLGLNYPTPENLARFAELKRQGKVPAKATPGAGVGIHGTWPNDDYMIDRFSNWTNGCIAMKNEDVQELYTYTSIGTPVQIRR